MKRLTLPMRTKRIVLLIGPNAGGKTMLARRIIKASPGTRLHEHPETGLYPEGQRMWARMFVNGGNFGSPLRVDRHIIETHSPYILAALNNLCYAGMIVRKFPDRREKVLAIVSASLLLDPAQMCGYFVDGQERISIMDRKTGLIYARQIDGCSNELGRVMNALLDIVFDQSS